MENNNKELQEILSINKNLADKINEFKENFEKLGQNKQEILSKIKSFSEKIPNVNFSGKQEDLENFLDELNKYISSLKNTDQIKELSDILDSLNGELSEIIKAEIKTEETLNKVKETLTGRYSVFTGELQEISTKISGYENSFSILGMNTENYFGNLKKSRNEIGSQISPSFFSESYSENLYQKLNGKKEEIKINISENSEVKKVLNLKKEELEKNKESVKGDFNFIGKSLEEKMYFLFGKREEKKSELKTELNTGNGWTTLTGNNFNNYSKDENISNKEEKTELEENFSEFKKFDEKEIESDNILEEKFQEKIEKNIELNNLILKKLEEKAENIRVKYLKLRLDGIHGNTINSIFEELDKYRDLVEKGNKIKRLKTKSPKFVSEFLSGIGEKNKAEYIFECKKYYDLSENIGKENGYSSEILDDLDSKIKDQKEKFSSNQNAKDEKFFILKEKISVAEKIIFDEEKFLETEKEKFSKKIEKLNFDKGLLFKINRLNNTRKMTSGNNLNYFNEIKVILENEDFLRENLGKNLNNRKNLENISNIFKILEPLISYIDGENINQVIENFDKNLKSNEKYERLLRVFINSIENNFGLNENDENEDFYNEEEVEDNYDKERILEGLGNGLNNLKSKLEDQENNQSNIGLDGKIENFDSGNNISNESLKDDKPFWKKGGKLNPLNWFGKKDESKKDIKTNISPRGNPISSDIKVKL